MSSNVATTFGATKPDEKLRLKVIRGEVKKAFDLESKEFQAAMVAKHKKILADRAAKKKEGEVKEVPTPESYDAYVPRFSHLHAHLTVFIVGLTPFRLISTSSPKKFNRAVGHSYCYVGGQTLGTVGVSTLQREFDHYRSSLITDN